MGGGSGVEGYRSESIFQFDIEQWGNKREGEFKEVRLSTYNEIHWHEICPFFFEPVLPKWDGQVDAVTLLRIPSLCSQRFFDK